MDNKLRGRAGLRTAITALATSALIVSAIGPLTDVSSQALMLGHAGTLPTLGRSPTTLQKEAGFRREPPMSLPSASGTMPLARAAAAPPLDPPADRSSA